MASGTTETKKEAHRVYLEENGVIDKLRKVLVDLYEEPNKPENPIDFIKKYLGTSTNADVDSLKIHHSQLKDENEKLKSRLATVKREIENYHMD